MIGEIAIIQKAVCEHMGITRHDMLSSRRGKNIVRARHIAIWVARHLTLKSYPQIGRDFNRDHSTAMIAVKNVEDKMASNAEYMSVVLWAVSKSKRLLSENTSAATE